MSNGSVEGRELPFGDGVFKLNSVREAEGDPESDLRLQPSCEKLGLVRSFAIDFDDIELAFTLIIESLERRKKEKLNPAELRAADAIHSEEIEGDAEGGIGIVGIMGTVAKLKLNHVEQSGLPRGAGDSDNPGVPAPESEVRKKPEVASSYEVKPFFEPHHGRHKFIIA